jgi:sarcosine oxidase
MLTASMLSASNAGKTYAVIGAGVFGTWTAYRLLLQGHKVTLLDQYGPASSRASSGGETRIIRCSYGPDEVYTRMAHRSLRLWSEFFHQTGHENLLHKIGVLWMAKPENAYVQQSRETLRKVGVPFKDISAGQMRAMYPQIQTLPGTIAIFEPESGALRARRAVNAVLDAFVAKGGVYKQVAVQTPYARGREPVEADEYIFACGAWLPKVLPDLLGKRIFPTRQEVLFFGIPAGSRMFAPPAMPVWIDFSDGRGMYGFPDIETRGFKVAFDLHGPAMDPDTANRVLSPEKISAARQYLADRFPALANAPIIESRVCQYENTANGDFLIDRHPEFQNVWIVGGGSGHGFKHGPAVGEYAAARITGANSPALEPRFSLASKRTRQNRAVY